MLYFQETNYDKNNEYMHVFVLFFTFYGQMMMKVMMGPFIYVLGVHITSTVKCSRYPFVQVENGTHLGLRSMTYCVYTAQRVRSF